jgi:feruloyl esterase
MPRLLPALALLSAQAAYGQIACDQLSQARFPRIEIVQATAVPAGPFNVPGGTATADMPAFCRVIALTGSSTPPEVRFELWLPVRWNSKLLSVGNGGLAGNISYSAMVKPLQLGYATSSTDTGHTNAGSGDATWATGHFERIVNFADRATHLMAEAGKVIIAAHYGSSPAHSYFNGCSQGGHEAFIEAQRYPGDYDGIIAGDPANYWTHHYVGGHLWPALATEGDAYIPAAKVPLLADAVNAACDELDGVKDGVLSDPRRCRFDPATLLCKGPDALTCLTAPQVSAINKIWGGLTTKDGRRIWPGLVPGGEAGPGGWSNWITGAAPGKSGHLNLGLPFFRYLLFDNPDWDYRTFRLEPADGFDSDIDYLDSKLGALFNAIDPDLTAFKARGGKLIHYHGWSDPDITPLNSIDYYESVVAKMGPDSLAFYRLFMVPGMQHCSGGPGATSFDMIEPLDRWVTQSAAPESILALKVVNGAVVRTRPLCPYPQEARWKGAGSTDDAANFSCAR